MTNNNKIDMDNKCKNLLVRNSNLVPNSGEYSKLPTGVEPHFNMTDTIQGAALSCFEKFGYNGTTIAQISKHAGVSPAAIYLYFPSKRALFNSLGRPDLDFPALRTKERQQEILQAALDVFSAKSYAGATMDDVAQAIGLSKASLYSYFPGKEELFQAMIENAPIFSVVQTLVNSTFETDLETGLQRIAYIYLTMFHHPNMIKLMKITLSEGTRDSELAATFIKSAVEHGANRLARYLNQVGYKPDEELIRNAKLFIGMLFSWVLIHRILAQPGDTPIPTDNLPALYSDGAIDEPIADLAKRLQADELEVAERVVSMIVKNLT